MRGSSARLRGAATFVVLVAVAEVCGRSLTRRVDRVFHVAPLARTNTSYYPFLLVGVKIVAALALAALLARAARAWAAARPVTGSSRHRSPERAACPEAAPGLSAGVWLGAFAATSAVYLALADTVALADGRWPTLAPGCTRTRSRSSPRSPFSSPPSGGSRAGCTRWSIRDVGVRPRSAHPDRCAPLLARTTRAQATCSRRAGVSVCVRVSPPPLAA